MKKPETFNDWEPTKEKRKPRLEKAWVKLILLGAGWNDSRINSKVRSRFDEARL